MASSDEDHQKRKEKSSTLPYDLILHEIFLKLPVKSLLRLRSACKRFKTLISSPAFIDLHLRQSLSSDVDRLLILAGRETYATDLNSPEIPVRTFGFKGQVIVGSCNGLVCMYSRDLLSLIIFNPCTETYKKFPIPRDHQDFKSRYGFGYDNVNDDYKVISLRYYYGSPDGEKEVTVYSLKSGEWSVPSRTPCPYYALQYTEGTLVGNNLLYWKFGCINYNQIACFDLQTNRWIEDIPFPDSASENRIKFHAFDWLHLGVVDRCLCLSVRSNTDASVVIWVMNEEHGSKQPWVKLASILIQQDISPWLLHPTKLDFQYMDSLFLFAHRSYSKRLSREIFVNLLSKLWWYDIEPKPWRPWRRVEIKGVPTWISACICKPSLVSIVGGQTMYNMVRQSDF